MGKGHPCLLSHFVTFSLLVLTLSDNNTLALVVFVEEETSLSLLTNVWQSANDADDDDGR